jgi:hypothetical protein
MLYWFDFPKRDWYYYLAMETSCFRNPIAGCGLIRPDAMDFEFSGPLFHEVYSS